MTEAATTLSVSFECLSAKTITTNEVELPPVSSVQQIKEYFEEKYDISVCLQTQVQLCRSQTGHSSGISSPSSRR